HGPAVVEDGARHLQELLVVLDLVGVLEEGAHHPGVGQDHVEPGDGLLGGHGWASGVACAGGAAATAGAGFLAEASFVSASSFEKSTRAAPSPTSRMPTHSFQPGTCRANASGPNGAPRLGCQALLTSVLMTGARPKINGAM